MSSDLEGLRARLTALGRTFAELQNGQRQQQAHGVYVIDPEAEHDAAMAERRSKAQAEDAMTRAQQAAAAPSEADKLARSERWREHRRRLLGERARNEREARERGEEGGMFFGQPPEEAPSWWENDTPAISHRELTLANPYAASRATAQQRDEIRAAQEADQRPKVITRSLSPSALFGYAPRTDSGDVPATVSLNELMGVGVEGETLPSPEQIFAQADAEAKR